MKQSEAYELLLNYVKNMAFYGDSGDQRSGAQEILDQIEGKTAVADRLRDGEMEANAYDYGKSRCH
jgi:hypothetical protein